RPRLCAPLPLQHEQVAAQRLEDLGRLGDEICQPAIGHPLRLPVAAPARQRLRYRRTSASSSSAVTGLARNPLAPTSNAFWRVASRPSEVTITRGVSR